MTRHGIVRVYNAHTGALLRLENARGHTIAELDEDGKLVQVRGKSPRLSHRALAAIPVHTEPARERVPGELELVYVPITMVTGGGPC